MGVIRQAQIDAQEREARRKDREEMDKLFRDDESAKSLALSLSSESNTSLQETAVAKEILEGMDGEEKREENGSGNSDQVEAEEEEDKDDVEGEKGPGLFKS